MSDIDPKISHLKIPASAFKELQALVDKPVAEKNKNLPSLGPRNRYNATILSLFTLGYLNCIMNEMYLAGSSLASLVSFLIGLTTLEWFNLYGNGLSRQRKAFLNVKNVLETYKVHNRTHGHLFQPEPDTPKPDACCGPPPPPGESPMNIVGQQIIKETANIGTSQDAAFDKSVQDHYGGMYDQIKRMNAELNTLKTNNEALSAGTLDSGTSQKLVPVDLPLPGQERKNKSEKKDK
ncbi:unnamed protein product [Bursaphelenchus okinawaensis]|uniref:Uncharacterized protein n=1 Tax=Bursaphelenchus okinawaensis TaxID=465554 RepID=A0A811JU76_9BILA|nr:unnamed protein product [Bursaphelenchus okinawaensis]CAG9083425.1 unnamed protein product [Bursaphelenchus okinawaensis]